MTSVTISQDSKLRTFFVADTLWNHPRLIQNFPLPALVRRSMGWSTAPRWLRNIVASYALATLDRSYRQSIDRMYAQLERNRDKIAALIDDIENMFGQRMPERITILVSPSEWATSNADTISLGIRPPEILEEFPRFLLLHELLHIAYNANMPRWELKGLRLYNSEEALELAIALLTQRMEYTQSPAINLDHYTESLRAFADTHREALASLLASHNSPVSLLESVDKLLEEYIRTGK